MEFTFYIFKDNEKIDITEFVGNISWNDSIDTLGVQLDFSMPNDITYINFFIECGNIITLYKGKNLVFQGIIIDKNINGIFEESFTAFDFAFYLNKSQIIQQFNNISAENAISNICNSQGIELAEIPNITTNINHIYYENTLAEIIDDILEQCTSETGKTYCKEVLGDRLYIFEKGSKVINPTYKMAVNVATINVIDEIGINFSKEYSISELRNKITIINQSDEETRVITTVQDIDSINKYGLLQHIESIDDNDLNKANNIAINKLNELNVISEKLSLELLGSIDIKSGRIINITNKDIDIDGNFIIISSNHNIESGIHKTNVEIERI